MYQLVRSGLHSVYIEWLADDILGVMEWPTVICHEPMNLTKGFGRYLTVAKPFHSISLRSTLVSNQDPVARRVKAKFLEYSGSIYLISLQITP